MINTTTTGSNRPKNRQLSLILLMAVVCSSSCTSEDLASAPSELETTRIKAHLETKETQIKKVKQATMRFHSFEQARKMGYAEPLPFNPSPFVPQMGYHYTNVGLLDANFELERPEILLYVPNGHGKLKLVAVEYAVPVALSASAPEGFLGEDDHWEYNPNVAGGAWTLHAWTVLENPEGIFAPFNPRVPTADPSKD